MPDPKHFQITRHGDLTVVHLDEVFLDRSIILEMSDAMLELIAQDKPAKLLVSFERVERFGSEAVGAMVRIKSRVDAYGGALRLCGMGPIIREIFRVTNLDRVFDIRESCREVDGM